MPIFRILQTVVQKCILRAMPNISKAFVSTTKDGTPCVKTLGSNLLSLGQFDSIDFKRVKTNDIYHISKVLGIEAARTVLVTEVFNVFDIYGINVDHRHLSLVADCMVHENNFPHFHVNVSTSGNVHVEVWKIVFMIYILRLKTDGILPCQDLDRNTMNPHYYGPVLKLLRR